MEKKNVIKATSLRQRAEEQLKIRHSLKPADPDEADIKRLLHELEVHQIELELQNEELKAATEKAETATALYDFSPAGYFTLNRDGTIFELNLSGAKMLGKERSLLINHNLCQYISPDSLLIFTAFLTKVFESHSRQTCEVALIIKDNSSSYIRLDAIISDDKHKCLAIAVDITDRKLAEQQIQGSVKRFQVIFDQSPFGIALIDSLTGHIIEVNEKFANIVGRTREEMAKIDWMSITHPDDIEEDLDNMKRMNAGETVGFQMNKRYLKPYGSVVWINMTVAKIQVEDQISPRHLCMIEDITDRKRTELELLSEKNHLKTIIDASPGSIWFKDTKNNFIHINLAAAKIANRSIEEVEGHSTDEIFPDQSEKYYEDDLEVIKSGKPKLGIIEPAVAKGITTWVRTDKIPWFDSEGNIAGIIAFALDITDRIDAEEALRESEVLLQSLIQAIPDLIWLKDKDGIYMVCNKMFEGLFGAKEAEIVGKTDYDFVDSEVADSFRNNDISAMVTGESTKNEEWLTFADDGYRGLFETTKTPMYDSSGELIGVLGIAHDITRHKQAEESLKESQQLFENLAQISPVGIFRTTADGYTTYVNPQWCELSGLSFNEAIGYGWLDAVHPDERERLRNGWIKDIEIQHASNAEYRFLKRDGSIVWVLGNAVAEIKDNAIVGFIGTITDITERKKSEELLKESEERFRGVFENATIGIYRTTPEGQILMANPAMVNMLGYESFEDLKSLNLELEGFAFDFQRTKFQEQIEREGEVKGVEFEWKRKDNSILIVRENAKAIRDNEGRIRYYEGMVENITERRDAEKEVKLLAHSLESISECVSITDNNDIIIFVNESFLKTYGYSKIELIGNHISILRTPDIAHEHVRDILPETIEGGWRGEIMNKRKDGTVFPILLSTSVIKDKKEKPIALIGVAIDISDMKKNREELIAAKENAEESNRLKTAFLAMMNHELRTPLNHILGFSELILSGVAPEESHSFAANIQSSGQNLLAIIEDVFELAMIEQENIKLRNQTYSFMDHFMETKASFDNILRTSAKNEQIQLVFKPDFHFLSSYVTADRSKINQVLTNLFKNAVKFTQKGIIEFGFTVSNESNLTFYIKDTGIGIPLEKQSVIFDYFRQGDDSYTRSYGGIGIGLAISRKIAKILNGELNVVSEPGLGSTFSLTIPVELSEG